MKRLLLLAVLAAVTVAAGYGLGIFGSKARRPPVAAAGIEAAKSVQPASLTPAVSVAVVANSRFVDTVLVTGSLVARTEVLITPEVEGLRIVELGAEEGDLVSKGQVLARLEQETLDAQLAQNQAAIARSDAAIAQARSQIVQAEARLSEARANFERAQPLKKTGVMSEATFDQREAAARTTEAQLVSTRDGLRLAEAERAQIQAQRREITWRRERTEVRAHVDGLVSRRTARAGGVATAIGEPMFRLAAGAEIELEAEVPEADMGRLEDGQIARIAIAGSGDIEGRVRLVSPEVDKTTRLGKVRITMGRSKALRIGAFGRGTVEVADSQGLTVPASSVMFTNEGPQVMVVRNDQIATRRVTTGLTAGARIEIVSGLAEGDLVVTKAGTFLRDGDRVRPVRAAATKVSEVN